ncbi:MAG: UvrD-helicase domain-containing protein, partial [Solirubrobacterales bacterium]
MTVNTELPPDQAARERITGALDTTMFVQAAAGSGKTKALVDRVLELIDSGVEVSKIAAITFTERAAGELRDRIRRALRDSIDGSGDDARRTRRIAALADIDDAAIGTLHGFALRLLAEHPIEAGLPITFSVRDEIASEITGDAAWDLRANALLADGSLARDIEVLQASGVSFDKIRELGESMDDCWDQISSERFAMPQPVDADAVIAIILRTLELVRDIEDECTNPENKLLIEMRTVARPWADDLTAAEGPGEIVEVLARSKPTFKWASKGAKGDWPDIDVARALGADLLEARDGALQALVENSVRRVICAISQEVVEEAHRRIAVGALSYDDLLVLARKLLTENPGGAVRKALHERYTHLLLDEFQDTDPLQLDIAMRLTADPDIELPAGDLATLAGRLFVVGDPQQSIYGFRGADLALYLETGERLITSTPAIGELQTLSTNFRTVGPVVDWINATFEQIIVEREHSQPSFEPLGSHRGDVGLDGPAVVQLGADPHPYGTKIGPVRDAEGRDIAAAILECMGDGDGPAWQIETEDRGTVPARLEDISILLPRRTSLPQITDALDAAGIPYRTESSGLAYASDEVRALIATLRAIDDFDDELALVNALRSPLFGCGDDDLMRFRADEKTRWRIDTDVNHLDPADPVVEAIGYLLQLSRQSSWSSPAALLDAIVRDRRLFELAYVDSRPRDLWRRVRFVIDQARSWSASGGGSLGDYIVWAERQMDDDNKVNEAILPETDDDAVRLLTVHASKGLEFPVVICAGLANVSPKAR